MSYNIDSIECLKIDAQMFAKDIRDANELHSDDFPEDCFLSDLWSRVSRGEPDTTPITLNKLNWRGEGSGNSWNEIFLEHIVPLIIGTVEAVVTWEGGDSFSGIKIKDGKFTECDVKFQLVPKKKGRDARPTAQS